MPGPRGRLGAIAAALAAVVVAATAVLTGGGRQHPSPVPDPIGLDREWAASMLLTVDDLPGSRVVAAVPVDGAGTFHTAAEPCATEDALIVDRDSRRGAAASALVTRDPTITVSSSAVIGRTEDEARSAMAVLTGPAFHACFADAITKALVTGRRFDQVTVSTAALPPMTAGEESAGYRSTIDAAGDGEAVELYVDYVFIRSARALAVLFDLALGAPLPDAERVRLASTMADRMTRG